MKHFIIFFIASVLMSQIASAQGWEPQISGTTQRLYGVAFVDSSRGWAVGDSGTIIHTADGGGSWTVQPSGTTLGLIGVDVVDANNGWAVGGESWPDSSIILHTTNGGDTWTPQVSGTTSQLNGVDFVDANNGWAAGVGGTIVHTTDAGGSWMAQNSGTTNWLSDVAFADGSNGWAVGSNGTILHTSDGGGTWMTQNSDMWYGLSCVAFVDANTGWAGGGRGGLELWQVILHTTDGGDTWTEQLGSGGKPFNDVTFVDVNQGWVVWSSVICHTTDGGGTWTSQNFRKTNYGLAFTDPSNGWAVGDSGTILRYNPSLQALDEHSNLQPTSFSLSTFPNPFNPSTTIAYDLPKAGHISLRVFDLLGREVIVLKDGFVEAGIHSVIFDGSRLTAGIYFARLETGEFSQTKKLVLLK